MILSVEDVLGVHFMSESLSASSGAAGVEPSDSFTDTTVNFIGGNPTGSFNPFAVPFLMLSGVVRGGVTIGGGIGYGSDSRKQSSDSATTVDLDALVFAPRLGVVTRLGRSFSLWLRGGVTYSVQHINSSFGCVQAGLTPCAPQTSNQTDRAVDLSFDPMFVYTPIPHVGLLFGPAVEIGVSGAESVSYSGGGIGTSNSSTDRDMKLSSFGVSAGVALFL
jgi:hypothetical protein